MHVVVDPMLKSLALQICDRDQIDLSDIVRAAIVRFVQTDGKEAEIVRNETVQVVREDGLSVEIIQRKRGRPRKSQTP